LFWHRLSVWRRPPSVFQFTLLAENNTRGSSTCLDYEATAGDGVLGYMVRGDAYIQSVLFDCPNLMTTDTANGDDPAAGRLVADEVGGNGANNFIDSNTLDGFLPGPTERGIVPLESDYAGAFGQRETQADNWTAGWTRDLLLPPVCPEGTGDAGYDVDGERACSPRLP